MTSPSYKVELISPNETIDLRSRILRPGQSVLLCQYIEDEADSSFHLGIRGARGEIICNGTFIQQHHELFGSSIRPYRLRGMATEPLFQKQGLGSLVIDRAYEILEQKKSDLLWFNARTSAEIFYLKLGFSVIGDIFEIPTIGPHKVMYKWL
jgi:GNAT superfamily N-acetyltransferase